MIKIKKPLQILGRRKIGFARVLKCPYYKSLFNTPIHTNQEKNNIYFMSLIVKDCEG